MDKVKCPTGYRCTPIAQEKAAQSARKKRWEQLSTLYRKCANDPSGQACTSLSQIKDVWTTSIVAKKMGSKDARVRRLATGVLAHLRSDRKKAMPQLITALLIDPDPLVRKRAAIALGNIGDRRATTALLGALKDKDVGVRQRAVSSLGAVADTRAAITLTRLLVDDDLHEHAERALSRMGDKAVPALIYAASTYCCAYYAAGERAGELLGKMNSERALIDLSDSCIDAGPRQMRRNAAVALGEFKDKRAVTALIKALKDPISMVRFVAARSLGYIKVEDGRIRDALIRALKDADPDVQNVAASALANRELHIREKDKVVPVLIRVLKGLNEMGRARVAVTLGQAKDRSAVSALGELIFDESKFVSKVAMNALEKIGGRKAEETMLDAAFMAFLFPRRSGKMDLSKVIKKRYVRMVQRRM